MLNKKILIGITAALLVLLTRADATVTLPYSFSSGTTIKSAELNADLNAVGDEINTHEAATNPHQTTLSQILTTGNSAGSTSINFNDNQAVNMVIEKVSSDPAAGNAGRLIYNTTSGIIKVDNGVSWVAVSASSTNSLSTVLTNGNSAGTKNLDMNLNQVLNVLLESRNASVSGASAGRIWWNPSTTTVQVDTGSAIRTLGGAQNIGQVLTNGNSAGTQNLDMNYNQVVNVIVEKLASDPAGSSTGRVYYNTTTNKLKYYNGSAWGNVGNDNTLAQVVAIGASTGADVNFGGHQALQMATYNSAGSPGTGTAGEMFYDTVTNTLNYETTTSNHQIASLDGTETLTNKSISGSSNTLTNIGDSSLSSNVALLNSNQSITGTKTFTAAPILTTIKNANSDSIVVPQGTGSDTLAYLNATQTMAGKTLVGPTFTGSTNFSEGIASGFRVENLSSDPAAGNAGRLFYKTTTGELKYDDGTNVKVVGAALAPGTVTSVGLALPAEFTVTNSPVSATGTLTGAWVSEIGNTVFAAPNGSTAVPAFRLLVGADLPNPSSAALGGVRSQAAVSNKFLTGISNGGIPQLAQPSYSNLSGSIDAGVITTGTLALARGGLNANFGGSVGLVHSTATGFTNQLVTNADIAIQAAIARPKIAGTTASSVLINNGVGFVDEETTLAKVRGGMAQDNTSLTFPSSGTVPAFTPNNHGVVISGSGAATTVVAPDASTTKVLTSGGASADPSWAVVPTATLSTANKTSAYTILASDDYVKATVGGNSFALTMPDATANTGKLYRIQKVAAQSAAYLVLATQSSQLFDGQGINSGGTTREIHVPNAMIEVLSDGTGWRIQSYRSTAALDRMEWLNMSNAAVCSTSPCTLVDNSPGITNVTRTSTGVYVVNFSPPWVRVPTCFVTQDTAAGNITVVTISGNSLNTAAVNGYISNTAGTASDTAFDVFCIGPGL